LSGVAPGIHFLAVRPAVYLVSTRQQKSAQNKPASAITYARPQVLSSLRRTSGQHVARNLCDRHNKKPFAHNLAPNKYRQAKLYWPGITLILLKPSQFCFSHNVFMAQRWVGLSNPVAAPHNRQSDCLLQTSSLVQALPTKSDVADLLNPSE